MRKGPVLLALLPLGVAGALASLFASNLDDFGIPRVKVVGPPQTVFDWSRDACEPSDYPDSPARAFRDSEGRTKLLAPHFTNRALVGPDLGHVRPDCRVVLRSRLKANPGAFDDKLWITAPYTRDGKTIFSLVHEEYQGHTHPGMCSSGSYPKCWWNSITLAVSRDGGQRFTRYAPPRQLVATLPYRYQQDVGPVGIFQPSNIVLRPSDGYFYALVRASAFRNQQVGSCLIRTKTLADPASWRAWDGDSFDTRFVDPYRPPPGTSQSHICAPVAPDRIARMTESLTYSTYFDKFLLVGTAPGVPHRSRGAPVSGFYFSLSSDLIHWTGRRLLASVELPWTYACGDRNPVLHPSVIDPDSRSRNFLTVDRRAYLYFVRWKYKRCALTPDRDLVRVPIEFSK